MSYKKARNIPAKANKEKQQIFLDNELIPLLEKAKNKDTNPMLLT